jgi:hypothetical protein
MDKIRDVGDIRLKYQGHILLTFHEDYPWNMIGDTPENMPVGDRMIRCMLVSPDGKGVMHGVQAESPIFNLNDPESIKRAQDELFDLLPKMIAARLIAQKVISNPDQEAENQE